MGLCMEADVSSVKIRPTVSPAGEQKNQEKKLNIRTFEGVYFAYMGKEPPVRIDPIFWR